MIDPTLQPQTEYERKTLDRCRRYGLSVRRVRPDGDAVRVTGRGMDLMVASLGMITKADLEQIFEPDGRPR